MQMIENDDVADKRLSLLRKFLLTSVAMGLLILAFASSKKPVLLHVFADTGCACGDYHAEVTGLVVRNPLRDRSPENTAARFLDDLRIGRCSFDEAACRYALSHRVSDWQLRNRQDIGDRVELYYRLTKYGVTEPEYRLTGEGSIMLSRSRSGWGVVGYSAYF
jgi:hypothetical protein